MIAGKVSQVIGSTFDAQFPEEHLPDIYNAVLIEADVKGNKVKVTGEVQQHLGGGRVLCGSGKHGWYATRYGRDRHRETIVCAGWESHAGTRI